VNYVADCQWAANAKGGESEVVLGQSAYPRAHACGSGFYVATKREGYPSWFSRGIIEILKKLSSRINIVELILRLVDE